MGIAVAATLAACALGPRDVGSDRPAFPVDWALPGFEGPLTAAAPTGAAWNRRGIWEAFDGRTGTVFLGPPMASPPPLPDLLATLDPDAVPAALPGGGYHVLESAGVTHWYRRFRRTGQACAGFVRTGEIARDTGAWGYYCAAPGAALGEDEIERALSAIRWHRA